MATFSDIIKKKLLLANPTHLTDLSDLKNEFSREPRVSKSTFSFQYYIVYKDRTKKNLRHQEELSPRTSGIIWYSTTMDIRRERE